MQQAATCRRLKKREEVKLVLTALPADALERLNQIVTGPMKAESGGEVMRRV